MLTNVNVCEVYTHACEGQRWTLVPYQLFSTSFILISRSYLLLCLRMLVEGVHVPMVCAWTPKDNLHGVISFFTLLHGSKY